MALSMDELQDLVKSQDLKYFIHPENPALMLGIKGVNHVYQVTVSLLEDGQFLQYRTVQLLHCDADDPNLPAALGVIGHLNYMVRLAKWGWDPRDGEINVCADVWIRDGTLTEAQFERVTYNFLAGLDLNYPRLKKAVETGEDPGRGNPLDALPPKIKELLDRLAKAAGRGEKEEEEEEEEDYSVI